MRTILLDVGPLAHLSGKGPLSGAMMSDYDLLTNPAGNGIVIKNGVIDSIQESKVLEEEYGTETDGTEECRIVSLKGHAVIPGLVDGHNHLLWAGDRSNEISMKQQGMSYKDIADAGGGIQHTVRETALASEEDLLKLGYQRMRITFQNGTTHMETKSGYGLSTPSELKLLDVAHKLSSIDHLPTMELTWLGAHDTPKGLTRSQYVE